MDITESYKKTMLRRNEEKYNLPNKNYETDLTHMIQHTKWFLEILGLWPMMTKNSSITSRYASKIFVIICLMSMAFIMIPTSLHVILRVRDLTGSIMVIGVMGPSLASFLKYAFIIYHSNTIKTCIEHLEEDWINVKNENDRAIMMRNVKMERNITIVSSVILYTGGMFLHTVVPFLKGTKINDFNETIRPLVYPGYDFFVNPQTSPTYEIIFCTTCFSAFVRYTVTLAACNLTALFVTHAGGQMEIVMSRLKTLFHDIDENEDEKRIEKRMSFLIGCHVRGLRLSSYIDEALREICLIEVVVATLTICLLEYCMTEWHNNETVTTITYFILLISYVFNVFVFCQIGELLKEQFQKVANATYMIEWYRLPKRTGLSVVLIIAIANYPHAITAGGMMELSTCTFGIIIKTSLMYLNMLQTMA